MNQIFSGTEAGKKNIGFGLALFLIFGVLGGIPLTVDFLGGSLLPLCLCGECFLLAGMCGNSNA